MSLAPISWMFCRFVFMYHKREWGYSGVSLDDGDVDVADAKTGGVGLNYPHILRKTSLYSLSYRFINVRRPIPHKEVGRSSRNCLKRF